MLICISHIHKSDLIYCLADQSIILKITTEENMNHFILTFQLNILTQTHLDGILCNLFLMTYDFDSLNTNSTTVTLVLRLAH